MFALMVKLVLVNVVMKEHLLSDETLVNFFVVYFEFDARVKKLTPNFAQVEVGPEVQTNLVILNADVAALAKYFIELLGEMG